MTAKEGSPTTLEDNWWRFTCAPGREGVESAEVDGGGGENGDDCVTLSGGGFGKVEEGGWGTLRGREEIGSYLLAERGRKVIEPNV